ncbi:MAG: hypothetical protein GX288_03915 [Clostridiales bacterium]|nr:hypothetical protein [Clostridiales bacterium]
MLALDMLLIEDEELKVNEDFIIDMGLDCLKNILTDSEYKVLYDTLRSPLIEVERIRERQNILQDFLRFPGLLNDMQKITLDAQENKFIVNDMVYARVSPKRKLKENLQVTNKSLDIPVKLLAAMEYKEFTSKTLENFYNNLKKVDLLQEIKRTINEMVGWVMNDCVTFDIEYGSGFKLKSSHIISEGNKLEQMKPEFSHLKSKFRKMRPIVEDVNEFAYNLDYILELQVEGLIERGVQSMYSVIFRVNSYILSFCRKMYNQLLFYSAAIKIVKFSQRIGCTIVYPRFLSDTIKAKSLYDLGLLTTDNSLKGKVSNDFNEDRNAFYVISGANQGGKTTFLKSIGIAQLFAQNGLPVFADEYDGPIFESFISHFPKDEDAAMNNGKLAEELTRFHNSLHLMKKKALVLMNESFATTTEKEGCEIAFDVLRALSTVKPSLFFCNP